MGILMQKPGALKPGDVRNKWTVLGVCFRVRYNRSLQQAHVAECECGTVAVVNAKHLFSGASRNCGCVRKTTFHGRTHGKSGTALYRVWRGMRERCQNENHVSFRHYGGAGVWVCQEWDDSFEAFEAWALANGYRCGLDIDRRDTFGPYTPENCRWVTRQVNSNNKRKHRLVPAWGESKTAWHWTQDERCKTSLKALRQRLKEGWEPEAAISTPPLIEHHGPLEAFGESKTLEQWAEDPRCVVAANCLRMRVVEYGWEPERALTTPARPARERQPITAFGETKELREWVRDPRCVVKKTTLRQRIYKTGWEPERAIVTPARERESVSG